MVPDNAVFGQHIIIFHKHQCCGQTHDVTRVKCSPAVSLEPSAKRRISSSNTKPMSWLDTFFGLRSVVANFCTTLYKRVGIIEEANNSMKLKYSKISRASLENFAHRCSKLALISLCPILLRSIGQVLKKARPLVARSNKLFLSFSGRFSLETSSCFCQHPDASAF